MKTLALAVITGIALLIAISAGAQVKRTLGDFGAAFDGQAANR